MNWLSAPEFKVGLLVLIVSGIIAGMSLRVTNDPSYLGTSKDAWFYIEDASGLVKGSNVAMAGINVGIIKDIKLENGQARVEMILQGSVPVTKSARIEIRPNGILGDKHVEIVSGDPRDPPLRSGEQILVVDDRASVDRLIAEVSRITKSLNAVADNIRSATDGDVDKPLGRIISNVEALTKDIAEITSQNKGKVGEILSNLQETSDTISELVNDESSEGLKESLKAAIKSLRKIEGTLNNVEQITGKINRGEGTLGRLVNDEKTIDEVNSAVSSINSYMDAATKLQTSIDLHSYNLTNGDGNKTTLGLVIQPGLDRFYELGIVSDARGVLQGTTTTTTDASGNVSTVKQDARYDYMMKYNLMFGKNFYDLTVRGGVLESSGGVGLDYHFFRRRLKISVEAFNFNSDFNLRSYARYSIMSGIYLMGGGENLTSNKGAAAGFVGAGIFLNNDDLKMLISRVPGL
jgi:phospholipid/cholesterol/gamma-HCH transport system substrate-binding protein